MRFPLFSPNIQDHVLLQKLIAHAPHRTGTTIVRLISAWKNADAEVSELIIRYEMQWMYTEKTFEMLQKLAPYLKDEHVRIFDEAGGLLVQKLSKAMAQIQSVLKQEDDRAYSSDSRSRLGDRGFIGRAKRPKYALRKKTLERLVKDVEMCRRTLDPPTFLIMKIPDPAITQVLDTLTREEGGSSRSSRRTSNTSDRNKTPLDFAQSLRDALRPEAEAMNGTESRGDDRHLFLDDQADLVATAIPFCTATIGSLRSDPQGRFFIVDTIEIRPGIVKVRDVRRLAAKLSRADPFVFGLLSCKGLIRKWEQEKPNRSPAPADGGRSSVSFLAALGRKLAIWRQGQPQQQQAAYQPTLKALDMVFRAPEGMKKAPRSLRQQLLWPTTLPGGAETGTSAACSLVSLTQRARIAKELAKSVCHVHTFAFVHKNIRPESILCFEENDTTGDCVTVLVGFDSFRAAAGSTLRAGDSEWERNLYRHPSRQGTMPAERFEMRHDVYSLGVCLLEVGLYQSFVSMHHSRPDEPRRSYKDWMKGNGSGERSIKDQLVSMAKRELPSKMGDKYTRVVLCCLTCLDEDNEEFGDLDEEDDAQGIRTGVYFIKYILNQLEEISM